VKEHEFMSTVIKEKHDYSAQAKIFEGDLVTPFVSKIHPQGHLQLEPEGGYKAARSIDYRLENVLSFKNAYSHVSGVHDTTKPEHYWSTLSTTVVEGLNIMEILTADRIVGQIVVNHPPDGYVPMIHFLGTRIENLRIAGEPVELDWNLDIFGDKPGSDGAYTRESGVLGRVSNQYENIRGIQGLPAKLHDQYNQLDSTLGKTETIECSLVNQAEGAFPGTAWGNVIHVPHFGTITLGKLTLQHLNPHPQTSAPQETQLQLTMIDLQFGCVIGGTGGVGGGGTGGH